MKKKKRLSQLRFYVSRKGLNAISNKGGGCASACGNTPRLSDSGSVCGETEGGKEGSGRAQVIEVSPPLPFFFPEFLTPPFHPASPPPPLPAPYPQSGHNYAPHHPHQLAPMIPHFLLNATPSALSLLTSQQPLQGNGKGCTRNWGGVGRGREQFYCFNTFQKRTKYVELSAGCELRINLSSS